MRDVETYLTIVNAAMKVFDYRQPFSPGMFEPMKPLFTELGYKSVAVYIVDAFPERMRRVVHLGDPLAFPEVVVMQDNTSLSDTLARDVGAVPGMMIRRLFNHGRELGALAAIHPDAGSDATRNAFDVLARTLSVMAYVERIRTNANRERQERDIFFSQSLTSRLLVREIPKTARGLRLGVEFIRGIEAGGDFFDLVPNKDGTLLGYVGCCNGKGLRTVLEVTSIMRRTNRALLADRTLPEVMLEVNDCLVRVKRRAHQASMCLFRFDPANGRLSLVKAGRLDIMLFDKNAESTNISTRSGIFLGMIPKPKIVEETHRFAPGSSFFCVTEGLYDGDGALDTRPQVQWFYRALTDTVAEKPRLPLANAIFRKMKCRPPESLLAVSVEFNRKIAKRR